MQLVEILIPLSVFLTTFGIFYLFLSTRHRERMSLIEKGADASLFKTGKSRQISKLIILNLALTLIGIGLGILIAIFLYSATGMEEVYPASIFTMAGVGLLTSFMMGRKYVNEDKGSSEN
jgi:hypothetical protein